MNRNDQYEKYWKLIDLLLMDAGITDNKKESKNIIHKKIKRVLGFESLKKLSDNKLTEVISEIEATILSIVEYKPEKTMGELLEEINEEYKIAFSSTKK